MLGLFKGQFTYSKTFKKGVGGGQQIWIIIKFFSVIQDPPTWISREGFKPKKNSKFYTFCVLPLTLIHFGKTNNIHIKEFYHPPLLS